MRTPSLTDDQQPDPVTLRPVASADVDAVLAHCTDPQMARWTTVPVPYTREHAEAFVAGRPQGWADDTSWTLAIEVCDDDGTARYAGNLSLRPNRAGAAEIGYSLAPWARGRGVMSRAVRLMLRWGLADIEAGGGGLQVVHWRAQVGNWASRRVAWACGFRVEGAVRGLCGSRGESFDGWIGSIVRGDRLMPQSRWLSVPHIEGSRVLLRQWRADDAPRVAEACADPTTQQWLPQLPSPYTVADAQWYIGSRDEGHAASSGVYWCVADPANDRCLGSLAVVNLDGPEPEIGYWAHPDARRRGVMTEATMLALRHAVIAAQDGGLGCRRVTVRAASRNTASNLVAQRAGFTQFGVAHDAERLRDGSVDDFVMYEALAEHVAPPRATDRPATG